MRTHVLMWWLGFGPICFLSLSAVVFGQDGPKLDTLDQYTRLQIPVTNGSSFRMLSGKSGEVTLVVDRVATGALKALSTLNDKRVREVGLKPLSLDKVEITIRFQEPQTESFAYQQGNVLVLDLWRGASKSAQAAPESETRAVESAGKKNLHRKRIIREPASKEMAPAANQVAPLKIDRDLFQKFLLPMPELTVKAKDGGIDLPPTFELDARWKFREGDKKSEDGKVFEFAKKLYGEKKFGLCLKTLEILLRDYPKTNYRNEAEFLRAIAYQRLAQVTGEDALGARAEKMLEELAARRDKEGKPLPFTRLIELYFAKNELQKGNSLKAIQDLEYVSSMTKDTDPDFPYIQMLLAESYGKVTQNRRAERLYRFIIEKYPKHILAKESYYRIADLLALEKNYYRVTVEGEAAVSTYPDYEKVRIETRFNVAEAYFWLGQYEKAEKSFRRFLEIASGQTNGSLAWVRLGEIEELHRGNLAKAREAYLRAKNSYPFSKGDLVATVRLARIDLSKEKQPSFVVHFLEELLSDSKIDWELKRMAELALADYLLLSGAIEKTIALAKAGMAKTDGAVYQLYKNTYGRAQFTKLTKFVAEKKFPDALELYEQDKRSLEEYGPDTFRVVSEIYRGLGLYDSANKFTERYEAELRKGSRLPSSLAATSSISRDKAANSFARGAYAEVLDRLGKQNDPLSGYFRIISLYRLGRKTEAYKAADGLVSNIARAKSEFTDDMIEDLAEIVLENDDIQRDYPKMERDIISFQALCANPNDRLSFAIADALWYQKRHLEAERLYKEAIEQFPKSIRADRARYNLGMSLVAQGKRDEAVKLLTNLRDSGQNVWSESARQELELIEWERKYSSVLKTLPPSGLGIAN